MSAPQDPIAWLRVCARDKTSPAELGPNALGPLTGQDIAALRAIGHCWNLYALGDAAAREASLLAVRNLVATMQPKCRPVARELIAYALDWMDREKLWPAIMGNYPGVRRL